MLSLWVRLSLYLLSLQEIDYNIHLSDEAISMLFGHYQIALLSNTATSITVVNSDYYCRRNNGIFMIPGDIRGRVIFLMRLSKEPSSLPKEKTEHLYQDLLRIKIGIFHVVQRCDTLAFLQCQPKAGREEGGWGTIDQQFSLCLKIHSTSATPEYYVTIMLGLWFIPADAGKFQIKAVILPSLQILCWYNFM